MHSRIPRSVLAALAALVIGALALPSSARADDAANSPPVYVTVEGVQLSYSDVIQLTALAIGAAGLFNNAIVKTPEQMPKASPYAYYAGKDASGKPVAWISSAVSGKTQSMAVTAELQREMVAAGMLAMLDMGQGSPKLKTLFDKAKNDPAHMARLGTEINNAMTEMSEKTVAYGKAQRRWIFDNIHAGTTRSQVYAMLRAHGLTARDFKGVTEVTFPGAFEPGCYFSNSVSITYKNDRLYKIDLDQPHPDCL